MKVRDARAAIEEQESEKVLQSEEVTKEAVRAAEQVSFIMSYRPIAFPYKSETYIFRMESSSSTRLTRLWMVGVGE